MGCCGGDGGAVRLGPSLGPSGHSVEGLMRRAVFGGLVARYGLIRGSCAVAAREVVHYVATSARLKIKEVERVQAETLSPVK